MSKHLNPLAPLLRLMPVKAGLLMGLLCLFLKAQGQAGERWFFTFGPSVSVSPSFEGGKTSVSLPDVTGSHHIQGMFSPLWGFPNPQYSRLQNLGRKIHLGFQYERFFSRKFAVVTGLELGARGYIIKSDFSNDLLVSYRTVQLPLQVSFSPFPGNFWAFRQNVGIRLMYASSIPERIERNIQIWQKKSITPQLYFGLELIHHSFSAPFSFEVGYSHGFYNVVRHGYLGLDYINPVPIRSTGSAFNFTVKYLFKEKIFPAKAVPVDITTPDIYDQMAYRNVKDPVEIKVNSDTILLCLHDDQTVDGDSVAIEFNQRIIQKGLLIQRQEYCFNIVMSQNGTNTLVVHALNEGKIPPNTCVMRVQCGDLDKEVRLKSDMNNSGAIRFYR